MWHGNSPARPFQMRRLSSVGVMAAPLDQVSDLPEGYREEESTNSGRRCPVTETDSAWLTWKGNGLVDYGDARWFKGKVRDQARNRQVLKEPETWQPSSGATAKMAKFQMFVPSLHCSSYNDSVGGHSSWMCLGLVPTSWLYSLASDGRTSRDLFGFCRVRAGFPGYLFSKTAYKRGEIISHEAVWVFLERESKY